MTAPAAPAAPVVDVVVPIPLPRSRWLDPAVYCHGDGPPRPHHFQLTGNAAEFGCLRCPYVMSSDEAIALL